MDRSWYFRFTLVVGFIAFAWTALWPSLDNWVAAPTWVKDNFEGRISPGLDIQGGLRLMYEVDVDEAVRLRRDITADQMLPQLGLQLGVIDDDEASACDRECLDTVREHVRLQKVGERRMRAVFENAADADKIERDWVRDRFPDVSTNAPTTNAEGKTIINFGLRDDAIERIRDDAVDRSVKTITNRIDELAIREMTVIGRDTDIIIEIPGGDDVSRLVSIILTLVSTQDETDGEIRITANKENVANNAGVNAAGATDAFAHLAEVGALTIEGNEFVIPDLEALRHESVFERTRDIVSRTARLEFKVLDEEGTWLNAVAVPEDGSISKTQEGVEVSAGRQGVSTYFVARGEGSRETLAAFVAGLEIPEDRQVLLGRQDPGTDEETELQEEAWRTYSLFSTTEVTGEDVSDAYVGTDSQTQRSVVQLEFNSTGADAFGRMTGSNVRRRMAIVLDNRVESAPRINERIGGGRCQISLGNRNPIEIRNEAQELVVVLKAGALPAPIRPSNEQLIGPTLGRDSVAKGAEGALVGIVLVLIFMAVYYQVAGVVADFMVLLNLLFMMAALAFFEATVTLPGIAGIALTIGMAVDANVLITERIREELRLGKSPRSAVDQGFRRAFWSIFDAQITTFIAGVIMFQYGTGPIKGFAVTLMIGIGTSLFTGIFCSKVAFDWIVRGLKVQRLRVG